MRTLLDHQAGPAVKPVSLEPTLSQAPSPLHGKRVGVRGEIDPRAPCTIASHPDDLASRQRHLPVCCRLDVRVGELVAFPSLPGRELVCFGP